MKLYKPYTEEVAKQVAASLLPDDLEEIRGLGYEADMIPYWLSISDHAVTIHNYTGEASGVAGVAPGHSVWMLCTPAIQGMPTGLLRGARAWLREVEKDHPYLWNIADCRNKTHHRLLRHLGFKALRTVYPEPYHLPYYEIVKLCAPQQ